MKTWGTLILAVGLAASLSGCADTGSSKSADEIVTDLLFGADEIDATNNSISHSTQEAPSPNQRLKTNSRNSDGEILWTISSSVEEVGKCIFRVTERSTRENPLGTLETYDVDFNKIFKMSFRVHDSSINLSGVKYNYIVAEVTAPGEFMTWDDGTNNLNRFLNGFGHAIPVESFQFYSKLAAEDYQAKYDTLREKHCPQ